MEGTQAGLPSPGSDGCQCEGGWDKSSAQFETLSSDDDSSIGCDSNTSRKRKRGPWERTVPSSNRGSDLGAQWAPLRPVRQSQSMPLSPPLSPMRKRKLRRLSDDLFPPKGDKKAHTQQQWQQRRNEAALFEEDRGRYGCGKKTGTVPESYTALQVRLEEEKRAQRKARLQAYHQKSFKMQMNELYSGQMQDGLKVVVPPKIKSNGMIEPARILVERGHGQGDSHKRPARRRGGEQRQKRLPRCPWMREPLPEAGTVAEAAALVRAREEDGERGTGLRCPVVLVGTDPEGRHFALVAPAEEEA